MRINRHGRRAAFTLLEVLTVMSLIGLLISLLLPGLSAAREQAHGIVCQSNIQQIMLANTYYAEDNRRVYCPGASEFLANLHRWHGTRDKINEVFDASRGPLIPYLGPDGAIRRCPSFPASEIAEQTGGFERGNGGYGYNNAYLGVRLKRYPSGAYVVEDDRSGTLADRVVRPAATVMFADSAFAGSGLIEYSFVEPRFHPQYPGFRMDPSIHFRHRGLANVGWCDGHVEARRRSFTWSSGMYRTSPGRLDIGWFGVGDNNSLFDLN